MKNIYLFVLFLAHFTIHAQIVNIPDPYFKAKLLSATPTNEIARDQNGNYIVIDANNDGEIQVSEALAIVDLSIYNSYYQAPVSIYQVQSVEGVKAFANLKFLTLSNFANVTSIDVSGMNKLVLVSFDDNPKMTSVNFTGCPILETIYVKNSKLTHLDVSNLPKLNILDCSGGDIQTINYAGSSTLKLFSCNDNDISSINLATLPNLKTLSISQNNLTTLDVGNLQFLEKLTCSHNQLTTINFQNNPKVNYLEASNNLFTTLNLSPLPLLNYLRLANNQITSINLAQAPLLQTLIIDNNLLTTFDITQNYHLQSMILSGNNLQSMFLKNGRNNAPSFNNNQNISYICCDEGEISFVANALTAYGYNNVTLNSYCSFTPGGTYYTIKGNTKYDENNNGCDPNDLNKAFQKFSVTGGGTTGNMIADSSGNYSIPVISGSHTITPIVENPSYFTISPTSISASFPAQASPFTQNFCLTANGTHNDLEVVIIPTVSAVPGFNAKYKIIYKNKGTTTQSGTITFTYNDNLSDFINSSIVPNSQSTGLLNWNFTNLHPFETKEIEVKLEINTPTDTPPVNDGNILHYTAQITGATDDTPSDNIFTLNQTVVNSLDPNDKTCLQGTLISQTQVGDYVHYVIRFENTGSANAQNIVVKDVIDSSKFDISTLIPLSSSHDFVTRITSSNTAEFIFEGIQLPFDDANNDGYVSFKIKTRSILASGDSFSNTANIYFDYNYPIITNTYTTTVESKLATSDVKINHDMISIYPNPVNDILNIKSNTEILKVEIFDLSGRILQTGSPKQNAINVSELSKGNYIIKMTSKEKVTTQKFIKN